MKNTVTYYYNLLIDNISQNGELYKIESQGNYYIFKTYYGSIDSLKNIYMYLINYRLKSHQLVVNKDQQLLTNIDNKMYILVKINHNIDDSNININKIISFNIPFYRNGYSIKNEKWSTLWSKKIDYYEYQINQFGKKYPLLRKSFSYFNGMSEIAISLSLLVDFDKKNLFLSHKRICKKNKHIDFYDPTNMIFDMKVRDACEYFKNEFFSDKISLFDIKSYLLNAKIDNDDAVLFLARMLFPTYYFDFYDNIIQEKENEEKIRYYLLKIESYEQFVKDIYNYMLRFYRLPSIEWLKK